MAALERIRELSDDQRRRFCRLGFVSFGIVPALLLAWWIAAADRRGDWERRCEAALGLTTRIGDFSTPAADLVRLERVELSDPELGWVVRIGELQLLRQDDRWSAVADRVEIRTSTLATAWPRLRRLLDLSPVGQGDFEVALRGVTTVADGERSSLPSWDRMVWTRKSRPDRVMLVGQLTPVGTGDAAPLQLRIERRREAELDGTPAGASLHGVLDTREQAIELAWLELFGPLGVDWGEECDFRGVAEFSVTSDGRFGCDLAGHFREIELQRWVGDRFRHVLQGRSEMLLSRCVIRDRRIVELAGSLASDSGLIGAPLLRALAKSLGLGVGDAVVSRGTSSETLAYRGLRVRFDLSGEGLVINGDEQRVLLADSMGAPLLQIVSSYPRSPHDLIRALVPDSRQQVPLTRETAELMEWFPLPSAAALAPEGTGEPRGVLRMEE